MSARVVIRRIQPKRIFAEEHLEKIELILKNHLPLGWTYKRNQVPLIGWYFWSWHDGWLLKRPGDGAAVGRLRMDSRQILVCGPRYIDELRGLAKLISEEINDTIFLSQS
jgi:hypothetical protein